MPPRFVADCMVGRLAKWLRALGFDVVYHPFAEDSQLVQWAREREAILLTRDRRLAMARGIRVIFVKDDHLDDQLRQVVGEAPLDLRQADPLSRCTVCNRTLDSVARETVRDRVPPYVYATQTCFACCRECGRIYWPGTHVSRMRERLARLQERSG